VLQNTGTLWRNCASDHFFVTMDIELIFKIAAMGVIISILNQVLCKTGRDEQATLTTLAGLILVLMMLAPKIAELFDLLKELFDY